MREPTRPQQQIDTPQQPLGGGLPDTPVTLLLCLSRQQLIKAMSSLHNAIGTYSEVPDDETPQIFDDYETLVKFQSALAYLSDPLSNPCALDSIAPFWEEETDADGEVGGNLTYEYVGDWAIAQFIATALTPGAAIVYLASSEVIKLAFGTTPGGAAVRVLLDGVEQATYTITESDFVTDVVIDAADFLLNLAEGYIRGDAYELRIEEVIQAEAQSFNAQSAHELTGRLQVFRKRIKAQAMSNDCCDEILGAQDETRIQNFNEYTRNLVQNFDETTNYFEINNNLLFDGTDADDNRLNALCYAISLYLSLLLGNTSELVQMPDYTQTRKNLNLASAISGTLAGTSAFLGTAGIRTAVANPAVALGLMLASGGLSIVATLLDNGNDGDITGGEFTPIFSDPEQVADIIGDAICEVTSRIKYPITQVGLVSAFTSASFNIPGGGLALNQQLKRNLLRVMASHLATTANWLAFVDLWGNLAGNANTLDIEYPCICVPERYNYLSGFGMGDGRITTGTHNDTTTSGGLYIGADDRIVGHPPFLATTRCISTLHFVMPYKLPRTRCYFTASFNSFGAELYSARLRFIDENGVVIQQQTVSVGAGLNNVGMAANQDAQVNARTVLISVGASRNPGNCPDPLDCDSCGLSVELLRVDMIDFGDNFPPFPDP